MLPTDCLSKEIAKAAQTADNVEVIELRFSEQEQSKTRNKQQKRECQNRDTSDVDVIPGTRLFIEHLMAPSHKNS